MTRRQLRLRRRQPEHLAHRRERRAAQHGLQPRGEPFEAEVVDESLGQRQPHARRIGIDLPGMDEQRDRIALAVARLDGREHAARRGHPQAPAAAERKRLTEAALHQRRKFEQIAGGGRTRVRHPRVVRIADDSQRRQAGIEAEPLPRQHLERPHRAVVDRPLRRAKAADRGNAGRLQRRDAAVELVGKGVRRQLVHRIVKLTVRARSRARRRQSARPDADSAPPPTRARRTSRGRWCRSSSSSSCRVFSTTRLGRLSQCSRLRGRRRRRCETTPRRRPSGNCARQDRERSALDATASRPAMAPGSIR